MSTEDYHMIASRHTHTFNKPTHRGGREVVSVLDCVYSGKVQYLINKFNCGFYQQWN